MLRASGLSIQALTLPDHHDYAALPWPPQTDTVVVTEKDAVKLLPARMGCTRVWVATLDLRVDKTFDAALMKLLAHPLLRSLGQPTESPHGSPTA